MSPDQYNFLSAKQRRILEQRKTLADLFPHLQTFAVHQLTDFKGVSFFLGDRGDVMVCAKRFTDGPEGEILWSSGDDLVSALINLERSLADDSLWRVDVPYEKRKKK